MTTVPIEPPNQSRLKKKIDDLQQQWELLNGKLKGLNEQWILENRFEEQLRLRKLIDDTKAQCDQVEEQLKDMESQRAKVDSDAEEGTGRNDDQSPKEDPSAYLQKVAAEFGWIDLGPLVPIVDGRAVRLPMDVAFIGLHAVKDVPLIEELEEEIRRRHELEDKGLSHEKIEKELEMAVAARRQERRERLEIVDVVKTHQRIVVLGDPGAGKTTLLRHMAHTEAKKATDGSASVEVGWFPVYLRLADYDRHWEEQSLEDFLPNAAKAQSPPLNKKLLADEIAKGRCLFLLDGLDEVLDSGRRWQIRERIRQFADIVSGKGQKCRIVVTSRIVGYRDAALPSGRDGFEHFTLRPMDDEQIGRFAECWFEAQKRELELPEHASPQSFTNEIRRNPGARRLATNPLLMALMALLYWREKHLPRQRSELYSRSIETLLDKWPSKRIPVFQQSIDSNQAQSLLSKVAFGMLESRIGVLISRRELEDMLAKQSPQMAIKSFLQVIGEEVGLLYVRGRDEHNHEMFSFLHLAFQEYFAACELAQRWKKHEFPLRDYLHHPRWKEPILLAAAYLSDEYPDEGVADSFVREVFTANSPYESLCHRDLILAARCLAEGAEISQPLKTEILEGLDKALSTFLTPLNEQLKDTMLAMQGSPLAIDVCELMLRKLDHGNEQVRAVAAEVLGGLALSVEPEDIKEMLLARIVDALLKCLKEDTAPKVKVAAARSLGNLGNAVRRQDYLKDALVSSLNDTTSPTREVGVAAAEALGNIDDWTSPPWTCAIGHDPLSRLQDLVVPGDTTYPTDIRYTDSYLRIAAAAALERHGQSVDWTRILERFLYPVWARDDWYWYSVLIPEAARQVGKATAPRLVDALIRYLNDERNTHTRMYETAIYLLGHFENAVVRPQFAEALLFAIDTCYSIGYPRWVATHALGLLGEIAALPKVVDKLRELVTDPSSNDVSRQAAWALGRLGKTAAQLEVIDALCQALDRQYVRPAAAEALGYLGAQVAKAKVVDVLRPLLHFHGTDSWDDSHVRIAAAEALVRLGEKSEALDTLRQFIASSDGSGSWRAVEAVRRIGKSAMRIDVVEILLERWNKDASPQVFAALVSIGVAGRPEVREKLLSLLDDGSEYRRQDAVNILASLGEIAAQPKVVDKLLQLLEDSSSEVRNAAAQTLGCFGKAAATKQVLDHLARVVSAPKEELTLPKVKDSAFSALSQLMQFY